MSDAVSSGSPGSLGSAGSSQSSGGQPEELQIFDTLPGGRLACRVCGALILREGDYSRIHWDWHEAANGA
jgi:hypothetical protein